MLRGFRGTALAAIVAALSAHASAAPLRPSFSALPLGRMPDRLDVRTAPTAIGKSERVTGLEISAGNKPRIARAHDRRPDVAMVVPRVEESCFTAFIAQRAPSPTRFPSPVPKEAFPRLTRLISLRAARGAAIISEDVHAIRVQTLVQDASRPHLEVTDAWVDPHTLGARLHAHTEIPLALVYETPLNKVFAFRDAKRVWLVVEVPQQGLVIGPQSGSHTTCGHVVADLQVSGAAVSFLVGAATHLDKPETAEVSVLELSASVSRTSRDRAPVFSVSSAPAPRELHDALAGVVPREIRKRSGPRRK